MILKKIVLTLFFILGVATQGWCIEAINISDDFKFTPIGGQIEIYLDATHGVTLSDLRSNKYDDSFVPHRSENFTYGINDNVLWLRFRLKNRHSKPLVLAIDKPFAYVDFYLPKATPAAITYNKVKLGYQQKDIDTNLLYRYPVYQLPVDLPENQFIYIRIQSFSRYNHGSLNFKAFLEVQNNYIKRTWIEISFFSIVFGVLASVIFYNLFLSLILKDKIYYIYIGYVSFILIYIFVRSGLNAIIGFPQAANITVQSVAIAFALGFVFSRSFLNSREHCRILDKLLLGMIACAFLVILTIALGYPKYGNILMHILGFGSFLAIATGIQRLYQGYLPARYYLIAWTMPALAALVLGMVGFGIIQKNFVTINALSIASTVEAILLSMALGDRFYILRKEKRALQKRELRLKELSITDELTGLYNKRWFSNKISAEIENSQESSQPLSLMVLDVDHFKRFNDAYRHALGDKVLNQLGKIITASVREQDIACRYGGEEFSIILPSTDLKKAVQVAERLRQNFAADIFRTDSGEETRATISIGVAELSNGGDEKTLFEKADRFLYKAKDRGRNQVVSS